MARDLRCFTRGGFMRVAHENIDAAGAHVCVGDRLRRLGGGWPSWQRRRWGERRWQRFGRRRQARAEPSALGSHSWRLGESTAAGSCWTEAPGVGGPMRTRMSSRQQTIRSERSIPQAYFVRSCRESLTPSSRRTKACNLGESCSVNGRSKQLAPIARPTPTPKTQRRSARATSTTPTRR